MKFCPVVPELCRGHVHVAKKERRIIIIIIIIIITISLQTTFGRLNYHTLTTTMTLNQLPYAHGHHSCKSITMRSRTP